MPIRYPAQIDNNLSIPNAIDNVTAVKASTVNVLKEAILAIENELGSNPKSTYGSVSERLNELESVLNTSQTILLAGDLGGTASNPKVIGLQGNAISATTPSLNDHLKWNGVSWTPASLNSTILFSNDLSGNVSSQNVIGIQSTPVNSITPTDKQVLKYVDGYSEWVPSILNQNDLSAPFTINITSTNYVEVGATITPVFSITYNFTPTSVVYSDSEGNTNVNIPSPFTSFTSPYSYTKSTYASTVDITLTATDGIQTVEQVFTIRWVQKIYYGLSTSTTLSESFIESLSSNELYYSYDEFSPFYINVTSTNYWNFAIRSVHENLFFVVNKIPGGISKVGSVSVTNSNGFAENYSLFKTDNSGLGNLLIEIETSDYTYI